MYYENQICCANCKYVEHRRTRYYALIDARCTEPHVLKILRACMDPIDGGYLNNECSGYINKLYYQDCPYYKPKLSEKSLWSRLFSKIGEYCHGND